MCQGAGWAGTPGRVQGHPSLLFWLCQEGEEKDVEGQGHSTPGLASKAVALSGGPGSTPACRAHLQLGGTLALQLPRPTPSAAGA